MKSKITFGYWEGAIMLLNLICTQLVLGFPRTMIEIGGTAGWMIPVYITVLALIFFTIIQKLYEYFEGKDIIDIGEKAAGRAGRIITGIIILLYLMNIVSVVLREFAEDMKVIALINSPISFVSMFFILGMIIGSYFGIEALVRFCSVSVPVVTVGFFVIIFGVAPYYDTNNFFPVLGNGIKAIFGKGFFLVSTFSPIIILFLINPFLKTHKSFKKVGYYSIALSGIFFFLGTFCYLLVYPYPVSNENFLPIFQLARLMEYGRFFQRIESIFVLIWATSALTFLSTGFYFIIYVFRKTFELEYHRPLIWPFIIIIFTQSLIPPNLMVTIELENRYYRNVLWIISFCMPIILLFVARLRGNKGKKGAKKA